MAAAAAEQLKNPVDASVGQENYLMKIVETRAHEAEMEGKWELNSHLQIGQKQNKKKNANNFSASCKLIEDKLLCVKNLFGCVLVLHFSKKDVQMYFISNILDYFTQ